MDITALWIDRYIFALILSFSISAVLIPIIVAVLKKFNILDIPDHRKVHKVPIPRMGGIAIYIGFIVPMLLIMLYDNPQKGIAYGGGIALLVGAIDDIWGISAIIKLIVLFALTILIGRYGVITSFPFHCLGLNDYVCNTALTAFWIVGICSAINALDHMDGLAGGISAIAAITYFIVSITTGQTFWGLMSIALFGSLCGFLVYNRHPAKIFMGDSGSFFLGFSLASIGVMGGWSENPIKGAVIPLAVLSLPIFDLAYVIFYRRFTGITKSIAESIIYCGKDHIGHRLVNMGFSTPNAVRLVYLIAATISISALTIRNTNFYESILLAFQIALVYIMLIIFMAFAVKKKESS